MADGIDLDGAEWPRDPANCRLAQYTPGHDRWPNGPCEDIASCMWCMSPSAALRPLGETFYNHDADCSIVWHWGPCDGAVPVENRTMTWLAEHDAALVAEVERLRADNEALREELAWADAYQVSHERAMNAAYDVAAERDALQARIQRVEDERDEARWNAVEMALIVIRRAPASDLRRALALAAPTKETDE